MVDKEQYRKDDVEKLVKVLKMEDELGVVLRTHAIIELKIHDFISLSLKNPAAIKEASLGYRRACYLAVALGLPESHLEPLKILGTIRNKFAHNHDCSLEGNKLVNSFYDSFSNEDKEIMQRSYGQIKNKPAEFEVLDGKDLFILSAVNLNSSIFFEVVQLLYPDPDSKAVA